MINTSFLLRPVLLGLALAAWAAAPALAAEPPVRTVVDWASQVPGQPAKAPTPEAYYQNRRGAQPIIVDIGSEPPSPFGEGSTALCLPHRSDSEEYGTVVFSLNPFAGIVPPNKGWLDVQFALDAGIVVIGPRINAASDDPRENLSTKGENEKRLDIMMVAGKKVLLVRGEDKEIQRDWLSGEVLPGVAHTFRMAWNLEGPNPGMRFFLDGQPLRINQGDELLPIDVSRLDKALNGLTIFIHGSQGQVDGSGFIGKITASE